MSRVWSGPFFWLAGRCRSIRWSRFTERGFQLRRVRSARVWVVSKACDQKSLVDHGNRPCCCVYRDLLLRRPLNYSTHRREKAPITQANACVSRLIQPLLWRCSRRLFCRILDRTLSYYDRFSAKWRAGFRRKERSQDCERLRSEGNGNGHRHCCTLHVGPSYQILTA